MYPLMRLTAMTGFSVPESLAGGKPTSVYNVSYSSAAFSIRWSAAEHRWLIWMDGKPATAANGKKLGARTVVVQYAKVGTSGSSGLRAAPVMPRPSSVPAWTCARPMSRVSGIAYYRWTTASSGARIFE